MTLVELLVTVLIIGLVVGIAGLNVATRGSPTPVDDRRAHARVEAVLERRAVQLEPDSAGDVYDGRPVLFLPDGRAIGPGIDPLTGVTTDARR